MLRVSFSPVPEHVVADCWNRGFPTPPCHQATVIIIIVVVVIVVLYVFKRISSLAIFWKSIITTQRYLVNLTP